MIIATHADADHIQGLARASERAQDQGRGPSRERRAAGDAATRSRPMPRSRPRTSTSRCRRARSTCMLNEGDDITVGELKLEVWHTPGHTHGPAQLQDGQPAFQRRQHLQGQLRRRHRRPSRLESPDFLDSLKRILARRCRVPAAEPRSGLPPRSTHHQEGDRPSDAVSAHGRLRHLCDRLAAVDEWESDVISGRCRSFEELTQRIAVREPEIPATRRESSRCHRYRRSGAIPSPR